MYKSETSWIKLIVAVQAPSCDNQWWSFGSSVRKITAYSCYLDIYLKRLRIANFIRKNSVVMPSAFMFSSRSWCVGISCPLSNSTKIFCLRIQQKTIHITIFTRSDRPHSCSLHDINSRARTYTFLLPPETCKTLHQEDCGDKYHTYQGRAINPRLMNNLIGIQSVSECAP